MLVVCCRGSVWSGRVMIGEANGVPCAMVVCVSWVATQEEEFRGFSLCMRALAPCAVFEKKITPVPYRKNHQKKSR
jgi:hypothetical protein